MVGQDELVVKGETFTKASYVVAAPLTCSPHLPSRCIQAVRTILPEAEELHELYALMALLVCLGAAATAYSATQAKAAVAVLAFDWIIVALGFQLAHAPILAHAARTAVLGEGWRRLLLFLWVNTLVAVNSSVASRYEGLLVATVVVTLCTARRVYLALLTLGANHKPSLLLPLLGRLIGTLNTSALKFKYVAPDCS